MSACDVLHFGRIYAQYCHIANFTHCLWMKLVFVEGPTPTPPLKGRGLLVPIRETWSQATAAVTMISTLYSGAASWVSPVARAGGAIPSIHASQTLFIA